MARKTDDTAPGAVDEQPEMFDAATAEPESEPADATGDATESESGESATPAPEESSMFTAAFLGLDSLALTKRGGKEGARQRWFDDAIANLPPAGSGRALTLDPAEWNGKIPAAPDGGETARGLVLGLAKAASRAGKKDAIKTRLADVKQGGKVVKQVAAAYYI